jgi:hypothetical protein
MTCVANLWNWMVSWSDPIKQMGAPREPNLVAALAISIFPHYWWLLSLPPM